MMQHNNDPNTFMHYQQQFHDPYLQMQQQPQSYAYPMQHHDINQDHNQMQMMQVPMNNQLPMQQMGFPDMYQQQMPMGVDGSILNNMMSAQNYVNNSQIDEDRKQRAKTGGYKRQELLRLLSDKSKHRLVTDFVDWPEMRIVYYLPDWRILVQKEQERRGDSLGPLMIDPHSFMNPGIVANAPTSDATVLPTSTNTNPAPPKADSSISANTTTAPTAGIPQPVYPQTMATNMQTIATNNFEFLDHEKVPSNFHIGMVDEKDDEGITHLLKKRVNYSHGRYTQSTINLPFDSNPFIIRQSRCSVRVCSSCGAPSMLRSRSQSCRNRGCRGGSLIQQSCHVTTFYIYPTESTDPRRFIVCIPDAGHEGHSHEPNTDRFAVRRRTSRVGATGIVSPISGTAIPITGTMPNSVSGILHVGNVDNSAAPYGYIPTQLDVEHMIRVQQQQLLEQTPQQPGQYQPFHPEVPK